jgi:hypothetical protein
MFRLLKLLAWVALGYVAYELYQGMAEGSGSGGGGGGGGGGARRGRGSSDLERALNEGTGRMSNLTGPGRGATVGTEDFQGGRSTHVVGRGVVSES